MYEKRSEQPEAVDPNHPLKMLTAAEFAALGGDAVAFVRAISGHELDMIVQDVDFIADELYQLVMSADGTPLLVTDTEDSVAEWLDDKNLGLVSVH
ncbi:DUF1150 family protein [Devosia rhodophyticola]|uniref:DUF1150 family protein n=1 Tax=Devosia rhodophyticola TaxID=3026423 RepID=A0ABY7Z1Q1_9HYPH|nr:DUF1150 family protein [Devosia rhodophyticola]WDR07135.1 DUF1150 family protein [Devosia rhodophyticola]